MNYIATNHKSWVIYRKILIIFFFTISAAISISFYFAMSKPTEIIDTTTDIDWQNPPCTPDELSDNWKEITDSRMLQHSNRRIFRYKDTEIKIAFEKGKTGLTGNKANDHWHRYNPNALNDRDLYLDINGNPAGKGSNPSHINPNCK